MTAPFKYYTNIPATPNDPADDQPLMTTNTNSINGLINVDHITFNNNTGGAHKQIQLQEWANTIPSPLLGTGFVTLFANATTGGNDLWMTRDNSGEIIQLTGPGSPKPQSPANMTQQTGPSSITGTSQTFLPGGMILFFGKVNSVNTTSSGQIVNFPSPGFPNNAFLAWAIGTSSSSTQNASITVASGTLSKTSVTFFCPTNNINSMFWCALGN